MLRFFDAHKEEGILLLRLGLGAMFTFVHGAPKLFGGPERWVLIGAATKSVGIGFAPVFWGFMAGFAEFFGGICLMLGLFLRSAILLLLVVMIIATASILARGAGLSGASQPIEVGIALIALFLTGPGKYSVDDRLGHGR